MAYEMLESDKELRNPKRKRISQVLLQPETKIVKDKPESG
jgi:hypothetical protein